MWKQESFILASSGDVWVAEEPLTVPLSSDEGSGHVSRSRHVLCRRSNGRR